MADVSLVNSNGVGFCVATNALSRTIIGTTDDPVRVIGGQSAPGCGYDAAVQKFLVRGGVLSAERADRVDEGYRRYNGTAALPTKVLKGEDICIVYAQAYRGNDSYASPTSFAFTAGYSVRLQDDDPYNGGSMTFHTCAVGNTNPYQRVSFREGGQVMFIGRSFGEDGILIDDALSEASLGGTVNIFASDAGTQAAFAIQKNTDSSKMYRLLSDHTNDRMIYQVWHNGPQTGKSYAEVDWTSGNFALGGGYGSEALRAAYTAGAVNRVKVTGGTTGNGVTVAADGETNVPMSVQGKGTGPVQIGTNNVRFVVVEGSEGGPVKIKANDGNLELGSDGGGTVVNMLVDVARGGTKVLGARDTGWTAMTGTTDKATSYDTSTVTLAQLAGRVMALQAALTTHGMIGA